VNRFSAARQPKGDNSWYPVYKKPLYPVDILDIRLLDSVETWLCSAIFQVFYSLTTVHWLIFKYSISSGYFLIFCAGIWQTFDRNLVIFLNMRLLYLWYPADILVILISGIKISNTVLPVALSRCQLGLLGNSLLLRSKSHQAWQLYFTFTLLDMGGSESLTPHSTRFGVEKKSTRGRKYSL